MDSLRIATFGFRSLPPREGSAGADKFALELYPRLVKKGCSVIAYNRLYRGQKIGCGQFENVQLKYFRTINKSGFDSLLHSLKATIHIIFFNTANIVHIHNGGNSVWALPLRLFGKKVFISQDGLDWKRDKWSWYGKLFLFLSSYITAKIPNGVIFDNIFSKTMFENKFKKKYDYIPYGSEVSSVEYCENVFLNLDVKPQEYLLFVGRFIPDKGLHYLIGAFEKTFTEKKLVLVGGSPNPSSYELEIKSTRDPRIVFPGYIYGDDSILLMKHAYAYIQPSDVEGLSPVILTVMGLGTPIICSDIQENIFAVGDTALTFKRGDWQDLAAKLSYALENPEGIAQLATRALVRSKEKFSWDSAVEQHLNIFSQEQL